MITEDVLTYYTRPGPLTSAGVHHAALRELPSTVPDLLQAVQGLLIHKHLTWAYDVPLTEEHETTSNVRSIERFLDLLLSDGRPLTEARAPAERLGGTCRDFTALTVAALRSHDVPARARCGFGDYFPGDTMEDHWVAEYWSTDEHRWVLADAQIDARQRELFGVELDLTDIPRDRFVVAGLAWQHCRAGRDDPNRYGLSAINEFGGWWIAANLVRDVAALSNLELLPWDVWGAMPTPEEEITPEITTLFDELAEITANPDTAADSRAHYQRDDRLRVHGLVRNAARHQLEPIIDTATPTSAPSTL
ncbi:MAG TPA: transglutaminase domain-containing protein [Mycobacterium sp.]|nr:transglutaminase domain-containing protein [Mycobacterium sp.]